MEAPDGAETTIDYDSRQRPTSATRSDGTTVNLEGQGVFVGARYGYLHGIRYVPDLLVEADVVRTTTRGAEPGPKAMAHGFREPSPSGHE